MQLTSSHCLKKKLTVHPVWESVVSSSNTTIKLFKLFTAAFLTTNIIWWRRQTSSFSSSYIAAADQEGLCSHVESITFTSRIIPLLHGTEYNYCLLSTSPVPPKWWINCCSTLKEKGKLGRERKGRCRTELHYSNQQPLSGSLKKPRSSSGLHSVAVKGWRANHVTPHTQSSPAVVVPQAC